MKNSNRQNNNILSIFIPKVKKTYSPKSSQICAEPQKIQASQGVDAWLGYGVYLPAIERIFALHQGETEAEFYDRTQYPADVVNAYTLSNHEIATLIAADKYNRIHQHSVAVNTSLWPLNDEGLSIDLLDFPNRLKAKI